MPTYQPVRRRPARRTRRPAVRRRRSDRMTWAVCTVIVGYFAFRSWPTFMTAALTVAVVALAVVVILFVVRPAWAGTKAARIRQATSRVRDAIPQRSALPRQLTAEGFHKLSPGRFEQAIAELAKKDRPYTVAAPVVGRSGDGGIDVRVKHSDGSDTFIQCKRYKKGGNVGGRDVRDANGAYWALHRCQRAVIVTTSDFTRDAHATNARLGEVGQPIRLVNGAALEAWAKGGPPPWR